MRKNILGITCLVLFSFSLQAQELTEVLESFNDTAIISRDEAPMQAPPIMAKSWNQIKTKQFELNFGFALIFDYNSATQDDDNITQVGKIEPATEFRGDRFIVSGRLLFFKAPWRYMIATNYNGLDNEDDQPSFSFIDWNIEIPIGKKEGWITIGKQKEGIGQEYIAPGTQLPFMERGSGAPIFIRQRNIGIRYSNTVLDKRATYTFGAFNNYWETGKSFSDNGSQITGRLSGLPKYTSDRDLMHFAIGYRYTVASSDVLSYKGRPEVNTAPYFLNTGDLPAVNASTLMLEFIKVSGSFSLTAELMSCYVNTLSIEHANFYYFQVGGDWFITGENRKYNRNNGNLGKLIPNKNFMFRKGSGPGAFELNARYTRSNLTENEIDGGKFGRLTGGLSWYANAHWRVSVNYGLSSLKRTELLGHAQFFQFRTQFEL